MASGVGLIPEQAWELPGPRAVAVRHRPDHGVDRLHQRRGRRLGGGADVVGRRSSCGSLLDSRRGRACSTARDYTRDRYVKRTQGETPLTVTAPADSSSVGGSRHRHRARRRRAIGRRQRA